MSEPSVFSKIIAGDIPCHKVYEDDDFFGIMDIHPLHEGHVVLISKEPVETVWELSNDKLQRYMLASKTIADKLKQQFNPYRVVMRIEGFDVPHAHVNIFPVMTPDGIHKTQDFDTEPDHDALAALAEKLRSL